MLKKAVLLTIVSFIVFFSLTCGMGGEGQYKSGTWLVIIKNSRYETAFGEGSNKLAGKAVDFRVQYLGPDGKAALPDIYLNEGANQDKIYPASATFNKSDQLTDKLMWLVIGHSGSEFEIKQGEYLSNEFISILWDVPQGHAYWLHVGDIQPINIF